ncbi:MAG: hypothetical protein EHM93_07535 [Bacteroidales bacterium]|nr:MAG: hypothetical protein EHM93_07535 [Bacteroidales bacterium]
MYIVRDKKTKKVVHINPAPVAQNLNGKEVYYKFDPKKMEIGRTDELPPEYFDINKKGEIVGISLSDLVKKGKVKLEKHQKVEKNQIIDKSVSELVAENLLILQPSQKVDKDKIVTKSLKEQVDEGIIKLSPNQKIKGNEIVDKSISEQVKEGIIKINEPFEYIDGNEIKRYTINELVEKKLLKTKMQCEIAVSMINDEIERKIFEKYSYGNEMKITKDYLDWLSESGSENDERAIAYKKMKSEIDIVKSEYKVLKRLISDIKTK